MGMQTAYRKFENKCELLQAKLTLVSNHEVISEEDKTVQNFLKKVLETTRAEMEKFKITQLALKKSMQKENQLLTAAQGQQQNWGDGNVTLRFDKLPDELLEMIVNKVEHFRDLESCSRAGSSLSRILEGKSPVWLLFQILPIIETHLNSKAILTCRKVCRHWKVQVDEYLDKLLLPTLYRQRETRIPKLSCSQSMERHRLLEMISTTVRRPGQEYYPYSPQFTAKLWQMLTNGVSPTDSSFYSKRLIIDALYDPALLWGIKNVKFLECVFKNVEMRDGTSVRRVSGYLSHLPHVKVLYFIQGYNDFIRMYIGPSLSEMANPLPKLLDLKRLYCSEIPSPICQFLFQTYAHQLEELRVSDQDFETGLESNPEILRSGLKNLIGFEINVTRTVWTNLEKLTMLNSPLKKLYIATLHEIKLEEIIPSLQHFELTLEVVLISLSPHSSYKYREEYEGEYDEEEEYRYRFIVSPDCVNNHLATLEISTRLYLPKVKYFVVCNYYGSLDFLLCLPFLKYLEITWEHVNLCTNTTNGVVEIYGFNDRMYQSNIWILFPFLKEYKYDHLYGGGGKGCFAREEYEYLQTM